MQPIHHIGRSRPQGRAGEGLLMITGPNKKKKNNQTSTLLMLFREGGAFQFEKLDTKIWYPGEPCMQ